MSRNSLVWETACKTVKCGVRFSGAAPAILSPADGCRPGSPKVGARVRLPLGLLCSRYGLSLLPLPARFALVLS
jgi:hypothetical protein